MRKRKNKDIDVISEKIDERVVTMIRVIGYFVLALTLLGFLNILIPPKFFKPIWEFKAIGQMVDQVWGFLIAFAMIFFFREGINIKYSTSRTLSLLSWLALILGIFYFTLVPLGIFDFVKINQNLKSNNTVQVAQLNTNIEKAQQRVAQSTSAQELFNIARRINPEAINGLDPNNIDHLKGQLKNELEILQIKLNKENSGNFKERMIDLYKKAFNNLIGSILSGTCLVLIWRFTRWARLFYQEFNS
jgi:hypothetical protein